jgi:predicted sulfurtransferase
MEEDNTVIIDVRNSYEADIGKFIGQEGEGGAEYIDPKMRKSTDFKAWLGKEETKEKLKGKQVMMYCTGGEIGLKRMTDKLLNKGNNVLTQPAPATSLMDCRGPV